MSENATTDIPALPKIEPWTVEQLRAGLLAESHDQRVHALAMSVQRDAPVDDLVDELARCVDACRADPIALQLAAVALGLVKRPSEQTKAANTLATLATVDNAPAVRIFAAHGFAQLGQVPMSAWPHVSAMLFDQDPTLRQVALRAATPFAPQGASVIAAVVAATPAEKWTTEGLAALALSAGSSADAMQRVEKYILRSLQGKALLPTGIAGYAALARLNPSGVAPQALAKIAGGDDDATALAAITAIIQLGERGKPAIAGLVQALVHTDNPEREEAICRALIALQIEANDVPLQRTLQRIEHGPDRVVAAHALLLSLRAKSFARTAPVVARRHATSSVALQGVLNELHFQLAGAHLTEPSKFASAATTS